MHDTLERIKKELLAKGADDVVIVSTAEHATQVKFSNNKVSVTQTWNETDTDIFANFKQRLVTTTLNDHTPQAIANTITSLVALAKTAAPNKEHQGIARGPFTYKTIANLYDPKVTSIDPVDIVEDGINRALAAGAKRTAGIFETSHGTVTLTTSGNVDATAQTSLFHFSLRALCTTDASGHYTTSSRAFHTLDYKNAATRAGDTATDSLHPKPIPPGTYDILFNPLPFAGLLQTAGEAASIFNVESGLSYLANAAKKTIASPLVTFLDDPTTANGIGSLPFDEEGTPSQRTPIIDKGVFHAYLHNASTAKRYNTQSTGNAGLIAPTPRNLILQPGTHAVDELISTIKHGIYITNIWYTRFQNYHTGQFSTIPRDAAFLIKNGKIVHPVKGIRISDTMPNILTNVHALGKNAEQILSWETEIPVTTPHALVKNVHVTKPVELGDGA